MFIRIKSAHPDYFLLALIIMLLVFGLVMLSSASSNLGKIKFNDSYYYLRHQLFYGLLMGFFGFLGGFLVNYKFYQKISFLLLCANLALLVLVFTPLGINANNASRWIKIGPVSFQPAELLKLTFIIYLAAWFANKKLNSRRENFFSFFKKFSPILVIFGVISLLLVAQPATSMVVILLAAVGAIYLASGAKFKYIIPVIIVCFLALGTIVYFTPYRMQRILGFLNPESDVLGTNYQRNQALIAIGSGGAFGVGYGNSKSKVSFLPAAIDDSIFAIIAEELGFVGASTLVVLFALLVFRLIWLAKRINDHFGRLILVGFASVVAIQSFINMASIAGLLPITGLPLPFISYGGTALAVFLTMSGISLNISKFG